MTQVLCEVITGFHERSTYLYCRVRVFEAGAQCVPQVEQLVGQQEAVVPGRRRKYLECLDVLNGHVYADEGRIDGNQHATQITFRVILAFEGLIFGRY